MSIYYVPIVYESIIQCICMYFLTICVASSTRNEACLVVKFTIIGLGMLGSVEEIWQCRCDVMEFVCNQTDLYSLTIMYYLLFDNYQCVIFPNCIITQSNMNKDKEKSGSEE